MQRLEVSGAARPIYGSLGVKWLTILMLSSHPYLDLNAISCLTFSVAPGVPPISFMTYFLLHKLFNWLSNLEKNKIKPKALIQSGTDALSNVDRVDLLLSNGLDTISPKL